MAPSNSNRRNHGDNNDANPFRRQFIHAMETQWAWLEAHYNIHDIFSNDGAQLILWQSALRSHGDFPIGVFTMSLATACSNGARTRAFGDGTTPLFMWALNSNYPQSRKSELTKMLSQGGDALNACIKKHLHRLWVRARNAERNAADDINAYEIPPAPVLRSVEIPNTTAEELFHRLSPDWKMLLNAKQSKCIVWKLLPYWMKNLAIVYCGRLINDDEFYNKANEFKMLTLDKTKLMEISEHQSSLNLFVTTGTVKRATKSSGEFGVATGSIGVTAGGGSNLHPCMSVPLQSKDLGQHICAGLDRFTRVTQRPVQPHSPLPNDLVLPIRTPRFRWFALPPVALTALKLEWLTDPAIRDRADLEPGHFDLTDIDDPPTAEAIRYDPSVLGLSIELGDKVQTAVAISSDPEPLVYLRVSSRRLVDSLPEEYTIARFVQRIHAYFADLPNWEVPWTTEARDILEVLAVVENVRCH